MTIEIQHTIPNQLRKPGNRMTLDDLRRNIADVYDQDHKMIIFNLHDPALQDELNVFEIKIIESAMRRMRRVYQKAKV